jgi:hypothetical protein
MYLFLALGYVTAITGTMEQHSLAAILTKPCKNAMNH